MRWLVFLLCGAVLAGAAFAAGRRGLPPGVIFQKVEIETSPHAEALKLVFEKCAGRIRELDRENWWHDTRVRKWNVARPFSPGFINSTHLFVVEYRIDDELAASWWVDTTKETADERLKAPATQPAK